MNEKTPRSSKVAAFTFRCGSDAERRPGSWWLPPPGSPPWVIACARCPICQHCISVSEKVHKVTAGGAIFPAWACPYEPCGFNRWVRFAGWDTVVKS